MGNYRLDISRFIDSEAKSNNNLKAVVSIQYPVYYIHSELIDTTPHILYGLDRVVLDSSKVLKNFDDNNISKILSLPSSVIKSRKEYMNNNDYLDENDSLTALGQNYINKEEEKIEQHISHDFIIDGISLEPLPKELYGYKYKEEYIFERDYNHYTDLNGKTISRRPFSPDLTHQPIQKAIVENNIINIEVNERAEYNIPLGIQSIISFTYSVCTIPILIGLFENNANLERKLINGFDSLGKDDHLKVFLPNLSERIKNLELRLDQRNLKDGNTIFNFESNWREIDIKREEDKLFFFSKEDLKDYFNQNYQIVYGEKSWNEDLDINEIFYSANSVGIIVTKEVFDKTDFKKALLLNLKRKSDYYLRNNITSGVWAVFFDFIPGDNFIKAAVELSSLIDSLSKNRFPTDKLLDKIVTYQNYRQILVALEENRLLEEIDIMNHMLNLSNE
tara:strand:- start:5834 stop:7177 length:1344 start_codon:yes stop_codon:yes gene_type:complete